MSKKKKVFKNLIPLLLLALVLTAFLPLKVQAASRKDQSITASNITVTVGDKSKKVNAKAKTSLSYKSSNPSVCGVSPQGKLTPKKGGSVKLTIYAKATSKYNSTKKTITVKVNRRNQSVSASNKTVYAGDYGKKISAKAKTSLSYKSSNPSVCGVSSNGTLTPKRAGTVKITVYAKATSQYNSAKRTITVNIRGDWYKRVLNQDYGTYKVLSNSRDNPEKFYMMNVYRRDFTHYKTIDINRDGVKELILWTAHRRGSGNKIDNRIFLLTYYKNEIKPLLCFDGNGAFGRFCVSPGVLIIITRNFENFTDEYMEFYFSVENGKLVNKLKLKRTVDFSDEFKYYVNGRQTTLAAWDNAANKYPYSSRDEITFSRIP